MSSSAAMTSANAETKPIASGWHTLLVVAPIAIGSVASIFQHGLPNVHLPGMGFRLSSYFTVLAIEWVPVVLIWLALRRRGLSLGWLVSGRWPTRRAFFRDLGLGAGFVAIAIPAVGLLARLLGADALAGTMDNVTPKTVLELVVSLGLSATGGFCEELVFRGYLTHQFSAWTGSRVLGIALQGVTFGLAHGYYRQVMLAIMVQGWMLGALAYWRKSLRPGMLAHGLQDSIGNVVAFLSKS